MTRSIGVIFDLDGTLADTLADITDAINAVFAGAGLPCQSQARIRSLIGEGLANLLRLASGVEDTERIAVLVERYRSAYTERLVEHTTIYPGIKAMLDGLTDRTVPMCVLSNKPHEYTAPICRRLLAPWPFVHCLGAGDEATRKPDPSVALALAENMNRSPGDVFFVGDSGTDIVTAANAGMVSVAVTWGYRERSELEASGPGHIVDRPGQLLTLIE